MGKGDRRTRRGKIYNNSHGKKRPGRIKKKTAAAPVTRSTPPARAHKSR
jgi:ribosomal small subunit protein bTHX